ncbi:hypothetical protein EST38_g8365 [Candolleomyces aberdarensis]|uniref:Uncharacterized protein n=1 Tax=Candolleomyces aberdarensis TaxID=2316362 RepID=A0A4Q2DEI7_9AGAR|nr:hypothetical protein EST38_g8365 [Candolleomyces aberdarensis]
MRHQLLQIHGGLDDPPRNGVHAYGHFAKGGQEESALRVSTPLPPFYSTSFASTATKC